MVLATSQSENCDAIQNYPSIQGAKALLQGQTLLSQDKYFLKTLLSPSEKQVFWGDGLTSTLGMSRHVQILVASTACSLATFTYYRYGICELCVSQNT